MAVSNAFGSNIFDILLGLGLPWMLQTCFADPGSSVFPYATTCQDTPCTTNEDCVDDWCSAEGQCVVKVNSTDQDKINLSMLLLLGSFFFMLFVIKLSRWKLTPALGWVMVACYFGWAGKQLYDDFAGVSLPFSMSVVILSYCHAVDEMGSALCTRQNCTCLPSLWALPLNFMRLGLSRTLARPASQLVNWLVRQVVSKP